MKKAFSDCNLMEQAVKHLTWAIDNLVCADVRSALYWSNEAAKKIEDILKLEAEFIQTVSDAKDYPISLSIMKGYCGCAVFSINGLIRHSYWDYNGCGEVLELTGMAPEEFLEFASTPR